MVWFEFVGPAGVGKTYFFRKLLQHFPSLHPDRLLVNRITASGDVSKFSLKVRLVAQLRQWGMLKNIADQMIIAAARRRLKLTYTEAERRLVEGFFIGLPQYDSDPVAQLRLSAFYLEKLEQHKLMEHYLGPNDLFLSEDGLVHLNFGIGSVAGALMPDVVISLDADDAYILKNRLGRRKSAEANRNEQLKTADELTAYVFDYNATYRKKVNALQQAGVRVHQIDVQRPDVMERITEIVTDCTQNPKTIIT